MSDEFTRIEAPVTVECRVAPDGRMSD